MGICQNGTTRAATTMKAEDIMMAGVSSIDQMLQGGSGMLVQQEPEWLGIPKFVRRVSSCWEVRNWFKRSLMG